MKFNMEKLKELATHFHDMGNWQNAEFMDATILRIRQLERQVRAQADMINRIMPKPKTAPAPPEILTSFLPKKRLQKTDKPVKPNN